MAAMTAVAVPNGQCNTNQLHSEMDPTIAESTTVHVRHEDAQSFAEAILEANGVSKDNAAIIGLY
jgi:hypothetical protein